jgi:hypothetical protein
MKAHIAVNQNAGTPTVLCWNLSAGEKGKLDGMAPAFGMRVVSVAPGDVGKTVAQLLGEETAQHASAANPASPAPTPAVLFANFSKRDLDTLLDLLKQAHSEIPLKAAATPTNRTWTFAHLLGQLEAERAAYAKMQNT